MTIADIFDDVAFSMLKDFRRLVEGKGGTVSVEFARPLKRINEPEDGYASSLGVVVDGFNSETPFRLGLVIFFPLQDIPISSREKRSLFRRNLVRAKKILTKQYKQLETTYGYKARPTREAGLGELFSGSVQSYHAGVQEDSGADRYSSEDRPLVHDPVQQDGPNPDSQGDDDGGEGS